MIPRHTGGKQAGPREGSFPSPPLAKFGVGARSFAHDTLRCRVGQAWRGHAAVGGRVALGRAGASRGILKPR